MCSAIINIYTCIFFFICKYVGVIYLFEFSPFETKKQVFLTCIFPFLHQTLKCLTFHDIFPVLFVTKSLKELCLKKERKKTFPLVEPNVSYKLNCDFLWENRKTESDVTPSNVIELFKKIYFSRFSCFGYRYFILQYLYVNTPFIYRTFTPMWYLLYASILQLNKCNKCTI